MLTITIKEREIIDKLIYKNIICYLGIIDMQGKPYVIPMNFGYDGDTIYLHSGPDTGSLKAARANPYVCITFSDGHELIHQHEEVACSYRMKSSSVICRGTVSFEEDFDKKIEALNIIMSHYTDRRFSYSEPAVNNVVIWKVQIEEMSSKIFGKRHKNSRKYNDEESYY